MKDLIDALSSIINKFDNEAFKETIMKIITSFKAAEKDHLAFMQNLTDTTSQLNRKNKQTESEIARLNLLQNKNTASFSKKNKERIQLSRKIIELEQENEGMENKKTQIEANIINLEEEIKKLSQPSIDEIYHEIIKGFGINFVNSQKEVTVVIKNKIKNDIFKINCDPSQVQIICDQIWELME